MGDDTEVTLNPAPEGELTATTRVPITARDDDDFPPDTPIGEYRIAKRIGHGGMGVVYEAVHPLIGKRAAVKILKKELCTDATSLQRFIDEARVVNQIGHPNIVDVFAFGELADGRSFFVMELLAGETLRARLARGPVTLEELVAIVRPLARALEAAHGKQVTHRDLKPDNIFLVPVDGERPAVKLLDFGIAKLARSDHRLEKTATGAMIGTPQYIAPEQAKGYSVDHRADIYSLGGIIFELVTRRPPFVADNAMEVVAKHLMEPPVAPSTLVTGVPAELDAIVVRMLAKDPAARPSLAELVAVIDRLRNAPATAFVPRFATAPAPASGPRSMPLAPRKRSPLPYAIAGAVAVAVAMFFIVRSLAKQDEPEPSNAEVAQQDESAAPAIAAESQAPPSPSAESSPPVTAPTAQATTPTGSTTTPTIPANTPPPPAPSVEPPRRDRTRERPRQETTRRTPIRETRPTKGTVQVVIVNGVKAQVYVDGTRVGEDTIVEYELAGGTHDLEVTAAGHLPHKSRFVVAPGHTTHKRVRLKKIDLAPGKELIDPGVLAPLGETK